MPSKCVKAWSHSPQPNCFLQSCKHRMHGRQKSYFRRQIVAVVTQKDATQLNCLDESGLLHDFSQPLDRLTRNPFCSKYLHPPHIGALKA